MPHAPRMRAALCGLLLTLAALLPAWSDEAKGKKYALLVGVKQYQRETFPDLKYTENDVEELAKILAKSGFAKVRVLTNTRGKKDKADAPTAANVRKALAELIEDKGRDDTVLVALSGHGVAVEVEDPDGKLKPKTFPVFCPSDADVVNVSYSTGRNKFLLNLNDLFSELGKCGASVKLVLMDACRNELKVKGSTRGIDESEVTVPKGVGALFSCSADERAFEVDKFKHGVFFHFVLEGLRGEAARNKAVTFDDLVSYVVDKVSDEVPKLIKQGAKQTPHRIINYRGRSPVLAHIGAAEEPVAATYVLKVREFPNKGGSIKHTETLAVSVQLKAEENKDAPQKFTVDTKQTYVETMLGDSVKGWPSKLTRKFEKASTSTNGVKTTDAFEGETILFERDKDGKYTATAQSKKQLIKQDADRLLGEFTPEGRPPTPSQELLPDKAVKVGDTWEFTGKKITAVLNFKNSDADKSKGKGKLVKVYKKGQQQWGTIEVTATVVAKFEKNETANIDMTFTFDVPIDGSSAAGIWQMKVTLVGTEGDKDKKATISTEVKRDVERVEVK